MQRYNFRLTLIVAAILAIIIGTSNITGAAPRVATLTESYIKQLITNAINATVPGMINSAIDARVPLIVDTQITQRVPGMIETAIDNKVPGMIDERMGGEPVNPVVNPIIIQNPLAGVLNVRDYGAKGDGVTDDRTALQTTIDAANAAGGGTVYVPDGRYMVSISTGVGLRMRSNVNLVLAPGAEIAAIRSTLSNSRVLHLSSVSNVEITGGHIIGDWEARKPSTSEYGMGISLYNARNVRIHDIKISECMGDGIYVSGNTDGNGGYSQNVVIEDFIIDDICRNGISIISGIDVLIQNGSISNVTGTLPMSFIDVEPNNNTQYAQNIYIKNIRGQNAGGYGYMFAFGHYYQTIQYPCSVTYENCGGADMALGLYNEEHLPVYENANPALFDLKWL